MCGIVAAVSFDRPIDPARVTRALAALAHRGPDGEGRWTSADRRVALAHARLSIIDHETGAQPIAGEDERVVGVVNGELYGYERQRAELAARGHVLKTRGDSEVAIHLFEEHGRDAVRHLRGELALVIWDERTHTLFAARDRFGAKPLCWAWIDGALWIASEAKALFAAGLPARWDRAAFHHAASLQYVPTDRTLFEGVFQLPPGHFLEVADGRISIARYWDFDHPPAVNICELDERAATARVRDALEESVRVRLRADVPVCFQLSGGLDSSAVVALAARAGAPLSCFTLGFDGAAYDERAIAEETARALGAELTIVPVGEPVLLDSLPDAVYFGEGLAINGHLPAKYLLLRAIRAAGFEVALSGEGSDEIFAGYPHLRLDLLRAGGDQQAIARLEEANAVTAGVFMPRGQALPLEAVKDALGFVPAFLEAKATYGRRMASLLSEDFRAEGDAYASMIGGFDVKSQLAGRHPLHQSLYLWSKLALANYILRTLGDAMEMAHGVEGRLPFLDHLLFDAVRGLPPSMLIRNGIEKHVLREAVRPLLPAAVTERRKHPLIAPPIRAFTEAGRHAVVDDYLRGPALAAVPFFDRKKVVALLDAPMDPEERIAVEPVIMTVLTACILHDRFRL